MSRTIAQTSSVERLRTGSLSTATVTGVVLAATLGTFLILATGFAGADVLHNAAHDVRHGTAFPCH